MSDVTSGSIFTGQSKSIAGGQNSAACPPPPGAPPVDPLSHFVVQGRCFQWKSTMFSVPSGKRRAARATCRTVGDVGGATASFAVFVALTQEVLSAGASFMPSGRENSLTHTHTLFCLPCVPSFLRVSFIALITTNKQEHPGEAASPVYISIGDTAQAKYLLVPN